MMRFWKNCRKFLLPLALTLGIIILIGAGSAHLPAFAKKGKKDQQSPALATIKDRIMIKPETFSLENGIQVVLLPDHRTPVVTHMLWYATGAVDELNGKRGLAHFLEHLMFKETRNIKAGEFSRIVAREGGELNAFTSYDYTAYYERITKDKLPLVMQMEADRMEGLVLREDEVAKERDVVLEERRMRMDNDPSALLTSQMHKQAFDGSPYAEDVIGSFEDISNLNRKDALDFYHYFYTPQNATLIIAGDITREEAEPLAKQYYGALQKRDTGMLKVEDRTKNPPHALVKNVFLERLDKRAHNRQLYRMYAAPAPSSMGIKRCLSLDMLAKILGGDDLSRLYKALVLDKKLATSVSAYYDNSTRGVSTFQIDVLLAPLAKESKESLEQQRKEIDTSIAKTILELLESGPTADETKRAKTVVKAGFIYGADSQMSMAQFYGVSMSVGFTLEDIYQAPSFVDEITGEDIRHMGELLLNKPYVEGFLGPKEHDATKEPKA